MQPTVSETEIGLDAGNAAALQLAAMSVSNTVAVPATIEETVTVASPPKFCRSCGAPRQPDEIDCLSCAERVVYNPAALSVASELSGMRSAIALYCALLIICLAGVILRFFETAIQIDFTVSIALSAVTLLWCIFSWRSIVPTLTRRVHIKWFAAALGLSLVTVTVAMTVIRGYQHLLKQPDEHMSHTFLKAGYGWGMVVLCIAVQPALIEELAFRGIVFGGLSKSLSVFETILVSAMMFMILHLSPARFPHTLALGLAAGAMRWRTKSLYPCMLMHFSHNLICVAMEYLHL